MTDDKLREAREVLEDLLRSRFPNTQFVEVRLEPDLGHDGDEILRVDAFYRGSDAEFDAKRCLAIITEMWDSLCAIGITAFPIHRFRDVDARPYRAAS